MSKLMMSVKRFLREEEGTEVVEWALAGGLIVAVGAAIFLSMGKEVETQLNKVLSLLKGIAPA